jgi:putative heme transporter
MHPSDDAQQAAAPGASVPDGVVAPEAADRVVPEALTALASLGWRIVAVTALVVVLWALSSVLWTVTASIAVAIVVAAVFAPWVLSLRSRGRSRGAAAALVWSAALLGALAVIVLLALAFLPYVGEVVRAVSDGIAALKAGLSALPIPDSAWATVSGAWQSAAAGGESTGASLVSSIAGVVTVMVLATFLVFFFLRDGDLAWLWLFQAFGDQKREQITIAGEVALGRVGGYLRGTTVLSAIIALTDLVFMLVLGVPLAVPLAMLVFLSGYIPYFGGIVTTAIVLLVTLAAVGTGAAVAMVALIAVRNAVLAYGVRPMIYGRTTAIHPALVLIALPAGFQIAGVIGLFVAVPVTAVLLALRAAALSVLQPDPAPVLPGLIPAWLDRAAQWSWRLLVGFALVALLVEVFVAIPLVLIPVVLATILAATLDPLVRALERRGRTRTKASAIAVGGGFLAIVAIIAVAVIALAGQADSVLAGATAGANAVDRAAGGQLGMLSSAVQAGSGAILTAVLEVLGAIVTAAAIVVLSCLLSFYFLRDGARLADGIFGNARPGVSEVLRPAASNAFEVLGGYMSGTAAISFVGAASQLVIMVIMGIPLALPVFVLSFFLCFIPYVGGFISTGIAFLLTVAYGTPTQIVIMAAWTIVFNLVTGNIVSPIVYGKTVHLHPAVVLVAIPAGAAIAGALGMFFVVPFAGVVAVLWRPVVEVMRAQSGPATDPASAGLPTAAPPAPSGLLPAEPAASTPEATAG